MTSEKEKTWLIRYPNFSFSRPLSEIELKQKFSSGEMQPRDEICAGNGYWFALTDVKEMRKNFGDLSLEGLFKKGEEEVTQERYAITSPNHLIPAHIKKKLDGIIVKLWMMCANIYIKSVFFIYITK